MNSAIGVGPYWDLNLDTGLSKLTGSDMMGLTEKLNDTPAHVRKRPPKVPGVRQSFAGGRSYLLVAFCLDLHMPDLRRR